LRFSSASVDPGGPGVEGRFEIGAGLRVQLNRLFRIALLNGHEILANRDSRDAPLS
jgi:hypothetical protein